MLISHLDHLVLTVKNIDDTINFYHNVLGMEVVTFQQNRKALKFGTQKINLHSADNPLKPHAKNPTQGSADLCFITKNDLALITEQLKLKNIAIEIGPVPRTGACGAITSIYIRDPDDNLIEISHYND